MRTSLKMDESINQISSQNTDFAVPFNSTSVLDGTMPDLLDSTILNSQPNGMFLLGEQQLVIILLYMQI